MVDSNGNRISVTQKICSTVLYQSGVRSMRPTSKSRNRYGRLRMTTRVRYQSFELNNRRDAGAQGRGIRFYLKIDEGRTKLSGFCQPQILILRPREDSVSFFFVFDAWVFFCGVIRVESSCQWQPRGTVKAGVTPFTDGDSISDPSHEPNQSQKI